MTDSKGRLPAISRRDLLRTAGAAGAAALVPGAVAAIGEEAPENAPTVPTGEAERRVDGSSPSDTAPLSALPLTNLTATSSRSGRHRDGWR